MKTLARLCLAAALSLALLPAANAKPAAHGHPATVAGHGSAQSLQKSTQKATKKASRKGAHGGTHAVKKSAPVKKSHRTRVAHLSH